MKKYKVKVVSDVVCSNLFKDFSIDEKSSVSFIFADVDQFLPAISTVDLEDFLIVHISQYAFNSIGITKQYIERIREVLYALEEIINRSSVFIILNSIYIDIVDFSQSGVLESRKLASSCNNLIEEFVEKYKNKVMLANIQNDIARVGGAINLSYRNYGIMRMPYSKNLLKIIANTYKFHLAAKLKARKKIIFIDADNTLWGGVVGEEGVRGVKFGHEYPGVNYLRLQTFLKIIKETGVILCLVTKNNSEDILEVFRFREMVIKYEDFLEIKSNWRRKSENIKEVLCDLNLDESSAIFIDDNPFEVEEVRRAFPNMECLQFEPNDTEWVMQLEKDSTLYSHYLTPEDLVKTKVYKEERERTLLRGATYSIDDYISSLSIHLKIHINDKNIIPRISQLTQKTNQFNLTTRRYTDHDIEKIMEQEKVFAFSVNDKFGDLGIVGIVIVINAVIDTFLLSCRAFGRGVENAMLREVLNSMQQYPLAAIYIKTAKNMMVSNFYSENGFFKKCESLDKVVFEVTEFPRLKSHQIKEISWM